MFALAQIFCFSNRRVSAVERIHLNLSIDRYLLRERNIDCCEKERVLRLGLRKPRQGLTDDFKCPESVSITLNVYAEIKPKMRLIPKNKRDLRRILANAIRNVFI